MRIASVVFRLAFPHNSFVLITASFTSLLSETGTVPESITFMPAGKHTISAMRGGKPAKVSVNVTEACAQRLQTALEARLAKNVRPFVDFNHEAGEASAIPKAFRWEAGRGVVLDLEWTTAGNTAVAGRAWSYFSPVFILGANNEPSGLPENGPIGGLVNDPAFENIDRIAAANTNTETMKNPLVEAGLLTEEEAAEDNYIETARAKIKAMRDKPDADVEAIRAENASLKQEIAAKRQSEAETTVNAAIAAGRIEPKNEAAKAYWLGELVSERAEQAKAALDAIPGAGLSERTITAKATPHPGGSSDKERRQVVAINAARAKHGETANFETVWEAAFAEDPDAFVPEPA